MSHPRSGDDLLVPDVTLAASILNRPLRHGALATMLSCDQFVPKGRNYGFYCNPALIPFTSMQ